jgi:TnpA family transposase
MADASAGLSERQITWARLFHIRPETYKSALAAIINTHLAHPFVKLWGNGSTSSSDGQFFRAAGRGAKRSEVNAHYSGDPGSKFYTWVSDQYGHFHILPMGATEDEAVYVLDGLYGHESRIDIDEHYVDTGGASDHVFSLFALGGSASPRGCAISRIGACTALKARMSTRPSSITSATVSMPLQSARAGMKRCAPASRSWTGSWCLRPC